MIAPPPLVAVLDDEESMRVALQRLLRIRGYQVSPCASGEELLAECARQPVRCIILDLHMPGMNGFEVLEELAARSAPPPVIVITGHDQAGNAERAGRLGARGYLTKPVDSLPLLELLAELVRDPLLNDGSIPPLPLT